MAEHTAFFLYKHFKLKTADDLPTTSAQAAATVETAKTNSRSRVTTKRRENFKKILDESTKKKPTQRPLRSLKRLNSSTASTASQIATRKLLKSIRRRQNQQFSKHTTPRKAGPDLRRQLNFSKEKVFAKPQRNLNATESTLEEGEIVSESDASKTENAAGAKKSEDEDDDEDDSSEDSDIDADCVCIEPQVELITIDDDTESTTTLSRANLPTKSQIITSTPHDKLRIDAATCSRAPGSPSYAAVAGSSETKAGVIKIDDDGPLPFFKDTSSNRKWLETITSEDSFADYVKLTTLRGGKKKKRRRSQRLKDMSLGGRPIIIDAVPINDDVIFLDESTLKPMQLDSNGIATPRKRRNNTDDSVIFVSESNPNALPVFIPLESDDVPNPIRLVPTPKTPQAKHPRNDLFTRSEKKQLTEYNDNAYNPSASDEPHTAGKRMVIIDGSNVAFNHALNKEFSVKGLKICLEYFEKMGHDVKAVVPQFRLNRYKSSDPDELVVLHRAGKIVFTPCKNLPGAKSVSYDDRFVLQLACELDAAIVSNDNYRDLINENTAFKKIIENRVIGYTWCNDIFILPKDPYGKWGPNLHTILNRK